MSERIDKVLDFFVSKWYWKIFGYITALFLMLLGAVVLKVGASFMFNSLWSHGFLGILGAVGLVIVGIVLSAIAIICALSGFGFVFMRIIYCGYMIKFAFENLNKKLFKNKNITQ